MNEVDALIEQEKPRRLDYPSGGPGSECPFPTYALLRNEAPVYKEPGRDRYYVTRYDDVMFVLRNPHIFANELSRRSIQPDPRRGWPRLPTMADTAGPATLVDVDGESHKERRALAFKYFRPGVLHEHETWITECVDALLDGFAEGGEIEFVESFARPLPILVTCHLMDLPVDDYKKLQEWGSLEGSGLAYNDQARIDADYESQLRLGAYVSELIEARADCAGSDTISRLICDHRERYGDAWREVVRADAATLIVGGISTTAHLLASAMLLLLQHPEQLAQVREDRRLIPNMLEEALRLEAPSQWNPRMCTADTEIAGVPIPAGSQILIMYGAANRDERHFEGPDEFHVERAAAKDHLSFGYGPHFCLGAPLARLQGKIAFGRLLDRFCDFHLCGRDVTHIRSASFRAPREVLMALVPLR
jgi:cytochrome P450